MCFPKKRTRKGLCWKAEGANLFQNKIKAGDIRHEKGRRMSMGQEEQKKKALEEKLRRRVYTAAFEAAQQRKEKPWQSWDEAFSERLAKHPFITEEERKQIGRASCRERV